ncbi:hypothetical protein I545_5094 [Mycobacterium kansasii 662]|uniref:Uncharacterized protein n=1 Tax=Mycobacterium kansasii 662 TaxID=1299326 RepID=X7YZL8_MYCKA|nr:hypothetical protein I545_5094 [Mycobacterium kansasii 662]KEP38895.1 hypothetical protein MKSMC1_58800 [Mycobacterium kansasii]
MWMTLWGRSWQRSARPPVCAPLEGWLAHGCNSSAEPTKM